MRLTINGNCPSQKNRKIISVNQATGRPFLRSAPAVKEWQQKAVQELRQQFASFQVTGFPIAVTCIFYFDNKRRRDLDNALSTVMDALTAAEILPDDSVEYVETITVQYGGISKDKPHCEIYIDD